MKVKVKQETEVSVASNDRWQRYIPKRVVLCGPNVRRRFSSGFAAGVSGSAMQPG